MTAVEVITWLTENYETKDEVYKKVFGKDYAYVELFKELTPQEIVYRIEEYKAKNLVGVSADELERTELIDWNKECERTIKILSEHKTNELVDEPKEEKQKIEKMEIYPDDLYKNVPRLLVDAAVKINELVDAVNELRDV